LGVCGRAVTKNLTPVGLSMQCSEKVGASTTAMPPEATGASCFEIACSEWNVEASISSSLPASREPGVSSREYINPPALFTINKLCSAAGCVIREKTTAVRRL
jgi:hypothetical protein